MSGNIRYESVVTMFGQEQETNTTGDVISYTTMSACEACFCIC